MAVVAVRATGPADRCADLGVSELPRKIQRRYEVHEWHHGLAILLHDHEPEWRDLKRILDGFELERTDLLKRGGNKTGQVRRLEQAFHDRHWEERDFKTEVTINKVTRTSDSHKVDCLKRRIAVEIEWNAKDMSFDRDLANFRNLFELKEICLGVIITRSTEHLGPAYVHARGHAPGWGTVTHMAKLVKKINQGGGGGCPIVVFGMTTETYEKPVEAYAAYERFVRKQARAREARKAARRRKADKSASTRRLRRNSARARRR